MWGWYQRLVQAIEARQYSVSHYAGSGAGPCRRVFRRLYYDFMTALGPRKPRWGVKALCHCADPEEVSQFESLWPQTRWGVCIRDPFQSFESQRNTFAPEMELHDWCGRWIATAEFVKRHDPERAVCVQLDRLARASHAARVGFFNKVLEVVGESASPETEAFIAQWPRVHKAIPDDWATAKDHTNCLLFIVDVTAGLNAIAARTNVL